jgi:hypothetical protein
MTEAKSTGDNTSKRAGTNPLFCARISADLADKLKERAARNRRQPARELELILIEALGCEDPGQRRG